MTPIRFLYESFFTSVLAGALMVWFYNRYLSSLRESYLKKGLSLAVLPLAVMFGIGHAVAVAKAWPVFWPAPLLGMGCFLIKLNSARLRRLYNHDSQLKRLKPKKSAVNYAHYPRPVALLLKSIEPWNEVDRLEIVRRDVCWQDLHTDLDGLRIVFLTDFHVHPTLRDGYFRRVVDRALALDADVLLIGGDFVSKRWNSDRARRCLARLAEHPRAIAVRGNHDFWTLPGYFRQMLADWNVELLTNEATVIRRGAGEVALIGIEDPYVPLTLRREAALAETLPGLPRIGLVHTPAAFPIVERLDCRFAFAGHTHGGQIRLPFFGTTISSCDMPERLVYGAGRLGAMETFVSNGIGAFYPMRISCPPQIVEITLRQSVR